jgi:hypothetical protein
MLSSNYVLITPARNEEDYIEKTIQSVISQTVLPMKWIIVSDGSTDKTDDIVGRYLEKYPFIDLLRRKGDPRRNFGSQVHAINAGYEKLQGLEYDFIGNLDADVSFPPDYYETLLKRFSARPRLGLGGGCIYEEQKGQFKSRGGNRTSSVPHAIQLFRRCCFEEIGGYVPLKYGGPDWHAEVMARLKGWEVESFVDLPVNHHKPTLTAEGKLKGGFRQGRMDYSLGSNPFFEVIKCLVRVRLKPYGLYSVCRLAGFVWGYVIREERPVSAEFMKFLREEQISKITNCLK